MDINEITGSIVDAAMKVHTALGSGLLEGVYEKCLKHELRKRGLKSEKQVGLLINFNVVHLQCGPSATRDPANCEP